MKQQYLPKVPCPVPVQHMAILYHSLAFKDRTRKGCFEISNLRLSCYVQAKFSKPMTVAKIDRCTGAAEFEWAKVYGVILYNRWYLLDTYNPKGFC